MRLPMWFNDILQYCAASARNKFYKWKYSQYHMLNSEQVMAMTRGLDNKVWLELGNYGYMLGGGLVQDSDGEVFICVSYKKGTTTGTPPKYILGFRVRIEEKDV